MDDTDDICFVCDKAIPPEKWKYKLKVTATKKRKLPATDLINGLVGEEYAVLAGERDAVCSTCMDMLNQVDSLTAQLENVSGVLKRLLLNKYNLSSEDKNITCQVEYDDSILEDIEPLHKCSICNFETKYEKEFNIHIHKHSKKPSDAAPAKKPLASKVSKKPSSSVKAKEEKPAIKAQLAETLKTPPIRNPSKSGHRTRSSTNSLKKKEKLSFGYEEKLPKKSPLNNQTKPKKPKVFFQCSICEKMFSTEKSIKVHAEKVHGKGKIEVTEEEEYADIQTLESDEEIFNLDNEENKSVQSNKNTSKPFIDLLDDWEEDEANDEITSPSKQQKTESSKTTNQTDAKKKPKERLRKKSLSFSEDDTDDKVKPTCLFCHAVFSSMESVQDHIKMTHREKSSYSSENKLKSASSDSVASFEIDSTTEVKGVKKRLNVPNIKGLTSLKSYKCNFCGIKKVSFQFIQKHVREHQRKMSLQCKFCGILCKNVIGLKVHAIKCHKIAPISKKCSYCKLRFVNILQLKNHVKKVHLRQNSKISDHNSNKPMASRITASDIKKLKNNDQSILKKNEISNERPSAADNHKISSSEVSSTSLEIENEQSKEINLKARKKKSKFQCQECTCTFDKPSALERHVSRHKANNCLDLGICFYCEKIFLSKDQMLLHLNEVHKNLKTLPKCEVCEKTYSHFKDLKTHYISSHSSEMLDLMIKEATEEQYGNKIKHSKGLNNVDNNESKKHQDSHLCYSCPLCSFSSRSKEKVEKHLSTHTKYYCHICTAIFNSEESIRHIENHSVMFLDKKCADCDGQFHDEIHLLYHIQNVHSSEKKAHNKCSMCPNSYKTHRSLLQHKQKMHAQKTTKVLSCHQCQMKFYSEKKFQTHSEFAHRPIMNCKYCDKGFKRVKTLIFHERNHLKQVKRIYKCNICGKVLKSLLTLKTHKTKHVKSSLQCDVCNKKFTSFYALREHSAKHSGTLEMKYVCDICDKGFYFYDSHCRHRRIHLELPKF